jgi:4-hydroxy-tetrahydrodipicolinate synthase
MKKLNLHGTYTALITPFDKELDVDFENLYEIVEKQISSGVEGLVVLGSTGEAATLAMKEKIAIMLKVQEKVNGRVPVIVGTGSNDTKETIEFTMVATEYNFDGILLVAPYYNTPSQEGLYQHFLAISEAVDIPQIIYNVPARTGVNIEPETQQKIAEDCKNVVGTKEASGDLEQIMEVIRHSPEGFTVMSGDDFIAVPSILAGAKGVVSVLSNYAPKMLGDCIRLAESGKFAEAMKAHYELYDLMQVNFIESNPVPVKAIMKELGLVKHSDVRLPLVPIQEANLQLIRMILKNKTIK